ncbi:MAG: hypothetical protein GXO88_07815 [Chlorobi bacterium]|nr:hypothetical protein [Chlorobiota bacterium]
MQIVPTTTKGLSLYVLATFLIVAIMFTQQYGWVNWNKYLKKGTPTQ